MDKASARERYNQYIRVHVDNVITIVDGIKEDLIFVHNIETDTIRKLRELSNIHDDSKWSVEEYEGYRQQFYPAEGESKDHSKFQQAWNHHQKSNPHHWEYWCLVSHDGIIPLDMPDVYILEMLCDWSAMSLNFGDTPSEFYSKQGKKMVLSDRTRVRVEEILPTFDKAVEEVR